MSKTASWRNGYCESGFADKRVHAGCHRFLSFAISDDDLPDGLLANAGTVDKEKHGSLIHRIMPHRVSRESNFGQLASGFNSGKSAGRFKGRWLRGTEFHCPNGAVVNVFRQQRLAIEL